MMLKEILKEQAVTIRLAARTKDDVINELVALLADVYKLEKKDIIAESIRKREKLGSTGMGQGIAIPHCKCEHIDRTYLAIGISKDGVDFKALDGEPVHIFFILVAPSVAAGPHLKALARISRLLRDEYFCRSLVNAPDAKMVYKIVITDDEKN